MVRIYQQSKEDIFDREQTHQALLLFEKVYFVCAEFLDSFALSEIKRNIVSSIMYDIQEVSYESLNDTYLANSSCSNFEMEDGAMITWRSLLRTINGDDILKIYKVKHLNRKV